VKKISKNEEFLRTILLKDDIDILRYNQLTEAQKTELSADLLNKIYKSVRTKSLEVDYTDVSKTMGDITKLNSYKDLDASITYLTNMYHSSKSGPIEILELRKCLDNLKAHALDFTIAYKKGNELAVYLYNNTALALIYATSFVISTSIEYTKNTSSSYRASFKNSVANSKVNNVFIKSLQAFNKLCITGDLKMFMDKSNSTNNFLGSALGFIGITIGIIGAIGIILLILRELVYVFYFMRTTTSLQIKQLAFFVQMNASTLSDDRKDVRSKQENMVKQLITLADKIAVEQKVASQQTENEIHEEDQEKDLNKPVDDDDTIL
jgi:hypothetical protein